MKTVFKRILLSIGAILFCLLMMEITLALLATEQQAELKTDRSEEFFLPRSSREHPFVNATDERFDIHIFGDSFTAGAGVMDIDTFPSKLEYLLNMNNIAESVWVHNKGRSGTSTYQRVRNLKNTLEANPDLVILQITLNDTEDWEDYRKFKEWRKETMPKPASGMVAFFTKHSRISNFIYSKIAILGAKKGFISYYDNLYDENYSGWKKFEGAIASFQDICQENDIEFMAVIFPLFSHDLGELAYPFHKYHNLIHEQLEANEIPYLDLFTVFEGLDNNRLQAIPDIDPHPSEIAHRMAAEALMRYLIDHELVPAQHFPSIKTQVEIHERWQRTFERMNPAPADAEAK